MALRIIHVGMGNWGQDWAVRVISQNKDVETVGWVDVYAPTLKKARERLKLPAERCFESLTAALAAVEAEAVLITASLPGHVPSALEALNARKHVLLEKPFASSIAEARLIVETAAQSGRVLMISQNYRFFPAARAVADLVRTGALGAITTINIDFRRYANHAPRGTRGHYSIWQPLLVDMSIHHSDLMRMVLGQEPAEVLCKTWNSVGSNFVEPPTAAAVITFDGGAVVSYRGSWVSTGPQTNWSGEWRMECEQGEIAWTSRGELPELVALRPLGKAEQLVTLPEVPLQDRSGSLAAFVAAVQEGKDPECSGRDNLNTLTLMLAAVDSSITGRPVTFPIEKNKL